MRDGGPISRNILDRQSRIFRPGGLAEQRGLSLALIEAETGIKAATLKSYRQTDAREPSVMPLDTFVKLARVLPADLAALLIEDSGFGLRPIEASKTNWGEVAALTAGLVADICEAGSDGQYDHVERAELRGKAKKVIVVLSGAAEEG